MTNKDAYWFSHDSNAKDDPKCMLLIDQLGLEGYGIYWILIETLREQPNYRYPLQLVPILSRRYNTSAEKMLAVIKNYSLFEINNDEFFFSNSLDKRMLFLEEKRAKRKMAAEIRWEKQRGLPEKTDANAMQMHSKCNTNEMLSKVKDSTYNTFYDEQIRSEHCTEQYENFVKFIFGENEVGRLNNVLGIETQVTAEQYIRLAKKSKEKNIKLSQVLLSLENYKPKNPYQNLYLTLSSWLSK